MAVHIGIVLTYSQGRIVMRSTILRQVVFTALLLVSASLAARANQLFFTGTTSLTGGDPTQATRLFRDGVPSNWAVAKAFPGTSGAGTYSYHTYTVTPGTALQFVQIIVDDPAGVLFVAAYQNSYTGPNATNYLGDAGSSGNPFPGIARSFQVVVPPGNSVVVVAMEVNPGGGVGNNFKVLIEGFADVNYTNAAAPTAAGVSVAGHVTTSSGRGIANARVSITGSNGETRTVTTDRMGFYRFEDVEAGKAYIISASSPRYRFADRQISISDDMRDLDIVADQ